MLAGACGDIRRASLPIPCGLNSYRHSIAFPWCGEGLYVGELVVAALVTGADRSHTAVGEPLLVINSFRIFTGPPDSAEGSAV